MMSSAVHPRTSTDGLGAGSEGICGRRSWLRPAKARAKASTAATAAPTATTARRLRARRCTVTMTSKGSCSTDLSVSRAKLRRSDMVGLLVVAEVAGHLRPRPGQARLDRPFRHRQLVRDLRDAEV